MNILPDGIIKEIEEKLKKETDETEKKRIGELYAQIQLFFSESGLTDTLTKLQVYINKKEFEI